MNMRSEMTRRWRKKGRRGVSPIIATILLVAITVVLAAVLYILISGLTKGPGNTPIGSALGLGTASLVQGSAGATFPVCKAADYCYNIEIASASGLNPSEMQLQVQTASGTVWSGMAGGGGAAISDIKGATVVSTPVAAAAAFAVTAWTAGAGYTTTSPVSQSMTIWVDMGTANPAGQGYTLVVFGTGSFSGQTTVALP